MKNIALIYFADENGELSKKASVSIFSKLSKTLFLSGLIRKIKRTFKIKPIVDQKIAVDENLCLQGIKVPYTLAEFNKLGKKARNRVNKAILKVCDENSINLCIMPAACNSSLKSCVKSEFEGKVAYTALVDYILEDLCKKQGRNVRDVDIAVIQGDDEVLPYIVIKLLSPVVKFITLVSHQKELMEKKIEQVCDETGLSVRITEDREGVLKNCDFVINYGNINTTGIKNKINSNAIVINYSKLEDTQNCIEKTVIGGIDIGLGRKYSQGFSTEILKFYSSTEIAEIILTNKIDKSINNLHDLDDYITVDILKKVFIEEGFYIRGYL